jgi:beta-glucanase (GH16 family)
VVPFAARETWKGIPNSGDRTSWDGVPGTGSKFCSDAVSAMRVTAEHTTAATLVISSVVAEAPVAVVPEWLGKRPPVEGEWVQTFNENFDSPTLESTRWNNTGPNFWDQASHWSKSNVIIGDGVAKLRYEKKTGTQNDEPTGKQTAYASGFLDTYGKWVQRYGYFEARMKLPTAPGLWPAFWMMPDRGTSAGEQWQRQDTLKGGMEFDIMEHLTRWGPRRYNIAQHWDGYSESHKQTGTGCLYVEPDKDGFITCGLLWTPGQIIYYCNGKETARWEDPRISTVASDLMFTLPTGGWDNNSIDDKELPADFVIDYVRAWQRMDLASPADTSSARK